MTMMTITPRMTSMVPAAATPPMTSAGVTASIGGGPPAGRGNGHAGSALGGGGLKLFGINLGKMAAFAALGAAAAAMIPPLAFLGGPIGGAIAGAALSLIL